MLHGLLPDLWGLVFAQLPPRDLLQFLLVDKAFSTEVRRDKHWRDRAGKLSFFTRLARVARQLEGDEKGAHTLELAYYCMALSLGLPVDWQSEHELQTRNGAYESIILQKNGMNYEIRHLRCSITVDIFFPRIIGGDWVHVYLHCEMAAYAYEFMAMTSGVPKSLLIRLLAAPAA